ncbi:MAG: FRG domain-containing protein [Bacteroidota bacterium]
MASISDLKLRRFYQVVSLHYEIHGVITSFEDAQKIIGPIRERRAPAVVGLAPFLQEYYRGQLSDKWNLKPSISRLATTAEEIKALEQKLMTAFKERMKEPTSSINS